ncbi:MAG: hypothetical protein ACYDHO_04265 [Gaiellaceae bacterium]
MRRALQPRPALALGALLLLGAYYSSSELLPDLPEWAAVVWVGFVLSALAFTSVALVLPLRRERLVAPVALVFIAIAVVLYLLGADLYSSLPKLAAAALLGFLFLRFFEQLGWVVLLALLIPVVDTLSVWQGPTHYVVTQKPQVFDISSIAFPVPGERTITIRWQAPPATAVSGYRIYRRVGNGREQLLSPSPFCPPRERCGKTPSFSDGAEPSGKKIRYRISALVRGAPQHPLATVTYQPAGDGAPLIEHFPSTSDPGRLRATSAPTAAGLGLPDVLFFALFLGAAARFGLRARSTWLALVCSLGLTSALAVYADPFKTSGLPALPGISLAFVLVNADLIWRRLRGDPVDLDSRTQSEATLERQSA